MLSIEKIKIPGKNYEYDLKGIMIKEEDTRSENKNPLWYMTEFSIGIVTEFKQSSTVSSPFNGSFCQVTTYIPWKNNSGGFPKQILYDSSSSQIAVRTGTSDTAWGSWKIIYSTNNKPSYSDIGANKKISIEGNTVVF